MWCQIRGSRRVIDELGNPVSGLVDSGYQAFPSICRSLLRLPWISRSFHHLYIDHHPRNQLIEYAFFESENQLVADETYSDSTQIHVRPGCPHCQRTGVSPKTRREKRKTGLDKRRRLSPAARMATSSLSKESRPRAVIDAMVPTMGSVKTTKEGNKINGQRLLRRPTNPRILRQRVRPVRAPA